VKGAAKAGALRRLSKLQASKTKDGKAIQAVEAEVECFDLAACLAPDRLPQQPYSTIQSNIKALKKHGIECPPEVHFRLVFKWAEALIEKEKWAEVGPCLRIWQCDKEDSYKVDSPMLGPLLAKVGHTAETCEMAASCLCDAVYGNASLALFGEPTDGQQGMPFFFAEAILQQYIDLEAQGADEVMACFRDIPESLTAVFDEVAPEYKGLCAFP